MEVTLPNGQVISGIPDGTTKQQIMDKAISSGMATLADFEPPKETGMFGKLKKAITGEDRKTEFTEGVREVGAAPELNNLSMKDFKTALGLLSTTDPEKGKNIIKANVPEAVFAEDEKGNTFIDLPSGRYILNQPGLSSQDVLRGAFNLSAFTPAGRMAGAGKTALQRTATGTIGAGATEAALQGVHNIAGSKGGVDTDEILLSSLMGGGGQALEDLLGMGYRVMKGKVVPPNKEAAQVIEAGKELDVPVMTSDVIEPETVVGKLARSTSEKIPFVGTGSNRAQQQEARIAAMDTFTSKYQEPSHAEIVSSMIDKKDRIKNAAGQVLNNTGVKLDEVGEIPVSNVKGAIDDALAELNKPNVRADLEAIGEIGSLKELMDMPQTFTTLKENRTIMNDVIRSFDGAARSQLPTRSKTLLQKAAKAMGDDMTEIAKANLEPAEFAKWQKANAAYAIQAEKLKNSKIKSLLDKGEMTPEIVDTMLFSKKPSEVKALYESLTYKGQQNARAALINKALDNVSKNAAGASPTTFNNELKKLAKNTNVFFKGDELKRLEGFKMLMDATRRGQEAAVSTATGMQLIPFAAGGAITSSPWLAGTGAIATGLGGKIYESKPFRDLMLKLATVPRGSDQYLKTLEAAQKFATSAMQAERKSEETEQTTP